MVPKMDKNAFVQAFDNINSISRQACRHRAERFCSVAAMVDGYLALYKSSLKDTVTSQYIGDTHEAHQPVTAQEVASNASPITNTAAI